MNSELIKKELDLLFPNPICELVYSKDYELVLSVMLSAQTKDSRVNEVTKDLYKKYNTLEKLNTLSIEEIEKSISSIGLYKTKAKNFKTIVSELCKKGYVPNDRDYLESLPGVGRKTTSVVLSNLFNEPNFAVDTHVHRVSRLLGISEVNDDVLVTEEKLKKYFNVDDWNRVNSQMVLFGRYYCMSKKPQCNNCKLKSICTKKEC